MKKSTISKIIVSIITFALIACVFTSVFADGDVTDLSNSLNSLKPQEPSNSVDNSVVNNLGNTTANSVENSTNTNSSSYPESDLPYAGPETSILMVAAFVICGIMGIYTFKKLSDYSNI